MLSPSVLIEMLKQSVRAWIDDFAPSMGAGIAYYTAFSIAPLLIIVIGVAGIFFGQEAASGYLYGQLAGLLGDAGAKAVQAMVESARNTEDGVVATVVGVVLLLVGATTVFAELQTDLDRIWKAPVAKKSGGLWGLIRSRLLSLGLVVSIGFVLLVSLVLSAGISALSTWSSGYFGPAGWVLNVVDFVLSLALVTLVFALMYKILPRARIAWEDVWVGAFVTSVLFAVGKLLVGLYIGKAALASSFGTAGSLAVLLVWVYYSAQIFLLGAEFTWIYAHRVGSRKGEHQPAPAKAALEVANQQRTAPS